MNKYQARCRLTAGAKITHQHFTDSEYLELKDGHVVTEEGYKMPGTAYNPWGRNAAPEGWEIFETEKNAT